MHDRVVDPIVTPEQMRAIDAAAVEPVDVLIERAGAAVFRSALAMLSGTYGRRVAVLVGKGNNGKDGLVAARRLCGRGVRVTVYEADRLPPEINGVDLVIDAAYGTGLRGEFHAPTVRAPVLAVDIPSGLDGVCGVASGRPLRAQRTVTFAALKPGMLIGDGPEFCGDVEIVDIGLDVGSARAGRMTAEDAMAWLPRRPRTAHKWQAAVRVLAGSHGMSGAAALGCEAAMRTGAGIVVASGGSEGLPPEVVFRELPAQDWVDQVLKDLPRFGSLLVGPGFGLDQAAIVARLLDTTTTPVVVDADALGALRDNERRSAKVLATPHDGEFARLMGRVVEADRFSALRVASRELGVTMLLKGPTTLVCDEAGFVTAVDRGDERLATAGSGDVLGGCIAALVAQGVPLSRAGALAAFLHGSAAMAGPRAGLTAGDLPAGIAQEIQLLSSLGEA